MGFRKVFQVRLASRQRRMQRCWLLASSAFVLALGGCGSLATNPSLSAAQVRFVELSPGSPEMDFYVNGTGAAYGIGFESFTSYLPVSPGAVTLTATRSGMGQNLASVQGTFGGGRQYTAVVSHGLGSLQEHVYPDQEAPALAGQMALRVLNEVEGVSGLTVYVSPGQGGGTPMVLNLAAGAASSYLTLPGTGNYVVTATVNDRNLNLPVASASVKAASGAVHTVVFGGTAQAGSRSSVVGFTLTDVDPS